jgi:glucose-6-phosphate dehydrogenase assembly protein OpcA
MAQAYRVLGQSAPGATTEVNVYTVPTATEAVISTIIVANRSASLASFRLAVRPAGDTLADKHYIAYDVPISANDSTTLTLGITAEAGTVITARGSSANLSFNIFGTEIS